MRRVSTIYLGTGFAGLLTLPETYVNVAVTNTSCLHVAIQNLCTTNSAAEDVSHSVHEVNSLPKASLPCSEPSMRIDIRGLPQKSYMLSDQNLARLACDLDPEQTYHIQITFFNAAGTLRASQTLFEGLWLSRGGHLTPKSIDSRPYFEMITTTDTTSPHSYPPVLATALNISHTVVQGKDRCLYARHNSDCTSLQKQYFGSKSTRSPYGAFAQRFHVTAPAAVLLELGVADIQWFLEDKLADDAFGHGMDALVREYTAFIRAIRSTAHEYRSELNQQIPGIDTSLAYNSEESTIPILLLSPVTKSGRIRRLISLVITRTVQASRANGDLFVHWVDTEGWVSYQGFVEGVGGEEQLVDEAHKKVAFYLSQHLCPLLDPGAHCPHVISTSYEGNLYIPEEANLGKLLEERKLLLLKERLGLFGDTTPP